MDNARLTDTKEFFEKIAKHVTRSYQYVVDESGRGTHKTLEKAMDDAQEHPKRWTMIRINPNITIDNFTNDSEDV